MRPIAFITLFVLSTMLPWYLVLPLSALYAFYWSTTIELLIIAALVDGYFGATESVPYYTLATVALLLVAEWLKPRLVLYNE